MAKSSGLNTTVKVKGESEYKRALQEIDSSLRVLGSELKEVSSEYDKNDRSVENLSKQNEVLTKKMEEQEKKVEVLKKALKAAAEETGENSETTKKYQIQLNNAQAELNTLNRQLEANKKDMDAAEKATESEKTAVKEMGDEVDKSSKKFEALGGVMKAGAAIIAAAGAAAVATSKKIWGMANDTAKAGDEIDKMSQKIGISAEAYQEWDYVFERSGADINNLQSGMKKLSGVIVDAANGSDSAAQKLAAVGLSINDLNGKSQTQQLNIVISALQKMKSGAERTAAANDLLGKSATDMAAVLNLTAEETAALKNEAHEYGMIMSDEAVAASANFEDSLSKLKGTISGVKNHMTSELLPGFTMIIDGFSDLVAGNDKASDQIKQGVTSLISSIRSMAPQFVGVLKTIGGAIIENLPDILDSIIDMIFDPNQGLLSSENIGLLVTGAGQVVTTLFMRLPDIIVGLIDAIPAIIEALFDTENGFLSSTNIQKLLDGVLDTIEKLFVRLPEIIWAIVKNVPSIIDAICDSFGTLVGRMLGIGEEAGKGLINGLKGAILGTTSGVNVDKLFTEEEVKRQFDPQYRQMVTVGSKPRVPMAMARGGVVTEPTTILAGDAGAEAFVPLENNTQWIDRVAERMFEANRQLVGLFDTAAPSYYPSTPAPAPVSISISFGDVQMASDMDVRDVADQISGVIAAEVVRQGRSFS